MKYDFLIFGFGETNSSWTNPQWMAHTLASNGYNVAYLNPPAYRKIHLRDLKRIFKRIFLLKKNKNEINFEIYNSFSNNQFPLKLLNKFENKKITKLINSSKNILCFQPLWTKFFELPEDNTTFLICDDYSSLKNSSADQKKYDKLVAKRFNKIIVTHKNLKKKYKNAFFSSNCVPTSHFEEKNHELLNNKIKKQVCFVGAIHKEKIDMDLIFHLVDTNPDYNFIFAGKLFGLNQSDLPKANNFSYVGELSYTKASSLMKSSEYGLIPFKKNNYTKNVFSMKYFEYIAAFTNPISTKLEMYNSLSNNLTPNQFIEDNIKINSFKNENLGQIRVEVLKNFSYQSRIQTMINNKFIQV